MNTQFSPPAPETASGPSSVKLASTSAGDTAAGQTTGQGINGFGAEWYVLNAAGNKIDNG